MYELVGTLHLLIQQQLQNNIYAYVLMFYLTLGFTLLQW